MMSAFWMRIVKRRYDAGDIDATGVNAMVPRYLTQTEADEILGIS